MSLTRYAEGSLRELCGVSLPLILFSFSSVLMFFLDRLFLAKYDIEALNAVSNSGTLMWTFATGTYILASMAEVFVAQFNGAGLSQRLGEPVWQMIWFALFTCLFFIPMGLFATDYLFQDTCLNQQMATDYFRLTTIAGPAWPLIAALSAFFIGQGKTRIIILLFIVANLSNIFLDWILIFGVKGLIPPLGPKGAAIGTVLGQIIQIIFLFILFLKKENRQLFGSNKWHFQPKLFLECVKVGFPQALLETAVVGAWSVYYLIMTKCGKTYLTVAAIIHSVSTLFSCIGEGVYKAAAALSGNFIGSKRPFLVPKMLRSGLIFHIIWFTLVAFLLVLYPQWLIDQFLPSIHDPGSFFVPENMTLTQFLGHLKVCLAFTLFTLFFENISWLFSGVLSGAGDTLFLFITGSVSIWLFLIGPIYYFTLTKGLDVWTVYLIMIIYNAMTCTLYGLRYAWGRWRKIDLLQNFAKS